MDLTYGYQCTIVSADSDAIFGVIRRHRETLV